MKIRCDVAKVEVFFAGNPPWEVIIELEADGIKVATYAGQFSHEEGQSGYDRVLKSLFQRLNDDVLIRAIGSWIEEKRNQDISS